ncbi:TPA: 50S ribosomal protein L11 [Candidatus Woesearchaeota archaeon]|nr:LSU ribosomal protein L11P [archaeon GW2011_AR15]MBS3103955.1 50S ribosomal protein L11 [Candidatus Woesearchaeota archaeon]HIH40977.1 50S ribosomal protein L11 [Candidatus Woesearchaeota archaeon]
MATEKVDVLVEGGKATAAPPLGPALGPMGVNIGQVVLEINKKTQDFKGMSVPVTVTIDKATKAFTISVGTPPASQLIIKEAGIPKGSGNPNTDYVADLKMEQIIKISQMKKDSLLGKTNKDRVKEVMGTCQSMGIMVEGKPAKETFKELLTGKYDKKIQEGKTELSAEELKELEEERKKLQKELQEKREEFMAKAKKVMDANVGKERKELVALMTEAGLPIQIINEVLPEEEKKPEAGGAPGTGAGPAKEAAKPAAGAKEPAKK